MRFRVQGSVEGGNPATVEIPHTVPFLRYIALCKISFIHGRGIYNMGLSINWGSGIHEKEHVDPSDTYPHTYLDTDLGT